MLNIIIDYNFLLVNFNVIQEELNFSQAIHINLFV